LVVTIFIVTVIVAVVATEDAPAAVDCVLIVPAVPVRRVPGVIAPESATVHPVPAITSVLPDPPVTTQVPTTAAGIPVPAAIVTFVPTGHVLVPPETVTVAAVVVVTLI
jgi:hypothetical protein